MCNDRFALFLGWTGIALFTAASIVDIFQLWEMENKPHPMSALALVIASLALLRTCDSKDGGGAHG